MRSAGAGARTVGHGAAPGERGRRGLQGWLRPRAGGRGYGSHGHARASASLWAHDHPASDRAARRGSRVVPHARPARQAARGQRAVDGHERGLRSGHRGGGDDGARGHGHLRASGDPSRAMSLKGRTIGFVGSGNMGEALIRGLVVANVVPAKAVWASDVRADRLEELDRKYGIQRALSNVELVGQVDVVILAVKPQIMAAVLREIAPAVSKKKLLISLAAGVSTARIRSGLAREARLIRVMPNTPALVLDGATAIAKAEGLEPDDLTTASEIFSAVGRVVVLEEELMDAVTGLSGSGPAYVALVIESLADGGVKMGLDRITAMTLATQTVLGAAKLLLETGMHPGALKDMVSSPGGTSIAGISALEEGGVRTTFIKAVERATQRSKELGQGPS